MASDTESIPSAVATTLPLRYPVIISTIPIARRVTTDIFAILLPAIIPSRTNLDEEEDDDDDDDGDGDEGGGEGGGKVVAELLEEEEEEEELLFSLLLLVAAAALAVVAVSLAVPGVEDEDE